MKKHYETPLVEGMLSISTADVLCGSPQTLSPNSTDDIELQNLELGF